MAKYKIIPSSRTIVQSPISIGHKAEKGVEAIEFDLTAWVETYGSGTATIIMKRWGDEVPYPVALEIDENNKATWTLSDTDTAKAGMTYAQLNYIVGETVVKKSDIYTFRVMDSLTGEGDPPEAYESWLEHLTHFAAEAMAEVLDIEGIVTDKTLTVDGGIADGKATGDALALKADKSTTYTKSEVDTLIKSVDVETDTTLSVSGKAADAKTVGDELGAINESLGDVSNDVNTIAPTFERTGNLIDIATLANSDIAYSNGVLTGKASKFNSSYGASTDGIIDCTPFASSRITFSVKAKKTSGDTTSGAGLGIRIVYSDNSASYLTWDNSDTEYVEKSVTSKADATISKICMSYSNGGANIWEIKDIMICVGENQPFVVYKTAIDFTARKNAENNANELNLLHKNVDYINESFERTRNLIDIATLANSDISYADGVLTGKASKFSSSYGPTAGGFVDCTPFADKVITVSVKARKIEGDTTAGNGFSVRVVYSDNTTDNLIYTNADTSFVEKSLVSKADATISKIVMEYSSGGANIWEVKDLMVFIGKAKSYVAYKTAVDYIAREEIQSDEGKVSIRNNLVSDGIGNLWDVVIYNNGLASPSHYGQDNVKYSITLPKFDKARVFFRFQFTGFIPYNGTDANVPIATIGSNGALICNMMYRGIQMQSGTITRVTYFSPLNGETPNSEQLNPLTFNAQNGSPAVKINYIGAETIGSDTSIIVAVNSGVMTFAVNGTSSGSITLTGTDTIQDFVDAVNGLSDFEAVVINSNGTVADLLLSLDFSTDLVESFNNHVGTTRYSLNSLIIPFAVDKTWHTCEMLVDKSGECGYVAYDGFTKRINFTVPLNDTILTIGGDFGNAESPIVVRDLEIGLNSYDGSEVVCAPAYSGTVQNKYQIISNYNPRLMIFEGHGIMVGSEAQAQAEYEESGSDTSDEGMQASTDRLEIIFGELAARGYVPVTWEQVLDWKTGFGTLPKRCYVTMFDDYRIQNFVDIAKRRPFVKYGVYAGLAMVSDENSLDTEVTIDGETYTIEQCIDMINRGGWYPCSHTNNHARLTDYTYAELESKLKTSVLSCDTHKMHSDILVYPYGACDGRVLSALLLSDFKIAVDITVNRYNCRATNDFKLTRTELGTRTEITKVLSPFV